MEKHQEHMTHWQLVNTHHTSTSFTALARSTMSRLDHWSPAPPISIGVEVLDQSFHSGHQLRNFPLNLQQSVRHDFFRIMMPYKYSFHCFTWDSHSLHVNFKFIEMKNDFVNVSVFVLTHFIWMGWLGVQCFKSKQKPSQIGEYTLGKRLQR